MVVKSFNLKCYIGILHTSLEIVAVSNPRKYPKREQWKYEILYQLFGRGMPASAMRCAWKYIMFELYCVAIDHKLFQSLN